MATVYPSFRVALAADLPILIAMLADDELGASREAPTGVLSGDYARAFDAIQEDPNNCLLIAVLGEAVAGFLQLTYIPYLTYEGRTRALIESVRVRSDLRGKGIGVALVEQAIALARLEGCHMVQLTTDKRRPEALRFYERMGFSASHEGMKLHLE